MNKYYYLILLFTFNFFTNSQAQSIKAFPEQDNEFVQVFSSYLSSNNRPQSKEAASWITDNLLSKTSPENLQIIKKTADEMLKNRIPLWPGFYDYAIFLKTIGEQSDISTNIVSQNHQILFDFLQKNTSQSKKDFTYYLKYLTEHYQSKAIYSDRSKSWKASASYQIDSENDYPVYIFPAITLHGSTSQDTLEILETSGKYYPFEHLWKSKSGKITWKRAGFDETDVHAQFQQYELQLNQPEIQIDSATLYFYPYISTPIQGKFIDKLFSSKAAASAFPKIKSYDRVPLKISNEIFLKSGVKLEGNRLVATSTGRAQPAELILYNSKNEKILEAEAERFSVIDFKRIEGRGVKLNFCYIDSTSIFHPSSALSYNIETKNLKITRENKSDARLPFVAPYFKMNLYVDQFEWDVDSNYIQLNATTAHATLPSIFESFDYYVPGADSKYQQLLNVDPIESLAYYCESMGIDRVTIDEVARVWSVGNYRHIEPLVFRMMEDGYMYYERETGMVDVFNKLFLHAKIRKDDNINYDNIRLSSLTAGRVGKLLLEDKKLEILGVEKTNLIPSGNISLEPSSDTVYISKNRDLIFKGMLTAGKFNFYSDSIQFDYDDYTFELDNIDSMLIMVPLDITDSKGNQYYTEINTPIKNISGTIYIADPENRNKSIRYSTYPYFDCNDTSTVVFNTGVFGDRYSPDHFKFNIYPFIINNLNTYETDSIKFKGLLQSDGIFENFETAISITKDRTLGLDFSTGEDPLPIFKNKALFSGHVILNQDGLTADGKIFKNNMTLVSDSILFLPDSAYALLSKWESIETDKMVYPVLKGTNSTFTWQTLNDSSFIQNESETQDRKSVV